MRAGVPIVSVLPQSPNRPLQKIFFVNMAARAVCRLGTYSLGLERRRQAIVRGTNRLQYARHCNAARCVAGQSADAFEAHCLMTDRKILGSKYCAAVRGFSILATRV